MPANPRVGSPAYFEQQVPGEEATSAQVVKTRQTKCVPFRCFKNVVVILEGGEEYKYFAPGVGGIRTEPRSSSGPDETEDLVNVRQLGARGLAEISAEVLKLDRHARTTMPAAFGAAPPRRGSPERERAAREPARARPGRWRLEDLPRGRERDGGPARRPPRARAQRDDEPGRTLGERQDDADLGSAGLVLPDAGSVMFDGRDLASLDDAARARLRADRIGVVLQRDNLIPFLSACENVELAVGIAVDRVRERERAIS